MALETGAAARRPTSRSSRPSPRCLPLRPEREAEARAGAGRSAVARLVMRPFERQVLDRAADADPVAYLRAARIQQLARQVPDRLGILALEHVEKAAIERLVDDEMREAAGADDADPLVLGVALDRGADRLAESVATPWGRLVRRVVGVDADRHDRHHVL